VKLCVEATPSGAALIASWQGMNFASSPTDGVPLWFYIGTLVRSRLTCHTVAEDPPETVLERANKLLNDGGFGTYNVATNNCFDFAFYCKTGVGFFSPSIPPVPILGPVPPNLSCMIL